MSKKIKVYQLLNRYSDKKILEKLFEKYPDQKNSEEGYKKVLIDLRAKEPKINDDLIKCRKFGCHIIKPLEPELTYAFGPIEYSEILGSDVNYANIDFICNLLWEITFYGFSEKENQDFFDEILDKVKEIQ